jgi:predicted HAD superfamily Cof-like phosphohydrolase
MSNLNEFERRETCATCGVFLLEHDDQCPRHPFVLADRLRAKASVSDAEKPKLPVAREANFGTIVYTTPPSPASPPASVTVTRGPGPLPSVSSHPDSITGITIETGGHGYTAPPSVVFDPPIPGYYTSRTLPEPPSEASLSAVMEGIAQAARGELVVGPDLDADADVNESRPESWFLDVLDFHRKFGATVGTTPAVPDEQTVVLRHKLIAEEIKELTGAMALNDLPGIADGCVDAIYVILGTAISYGVDLRPVWNAVQIANLSKIGGVIREDGKKLKPDGFIPPDVAGILEKQGSLGDI